jgi:hypothetical protein
VESAVDFFDFTLHGKRDSLVRWAGHGILP